MTLYNNYFQWYHKAGKYISKDTFLTDDIKIAILTDSYTPNAAAHEFYDVDITGELPTANGYTSGGLSLTTKTVTETSPGIWAFLADNPNWDIVTASVSGFTYILYNNTPASNKPVLGYAYLDYNDGTPAVVTVTPGNPLTVVLGSLGFFKLTLQDGI